MFPTQWSVLSSLTWCVCVLWLHDSVSPLPSVTLNGLSWFSLGLHGLLVKSMSLTSSSSSSFWVPMFPDLGLGSSHSTHNSSSEHTTPFTISWMLVPYFWKKRNDQTLLAISPQINLKEKSLGSKLGPLSRFSSFNILYLSGATVDSSIYLPRAEMWQASRFSFLI